MHRFQYKLVNSISSVISNILLSSTKSLMKKEKTERQLKRKPNKFILKKIWLRKLIRSTWDTCQLLFKKKEESDDGKVI